MKGNISLITRFFLFASGSTFELINKCPRFEVNKYASIGLTVLFTTFLSVLSSYYAFSLIFDSNFLAIPLSLLWGCIIFNLDRYIVSTMRMNESKWREFLKSTPRLLIAFLIAIVISKPLEIKMFDSEIETYLNKEKIELSYNVGKKYSSDLRLLESKKLLLESDFQKQLRLRDKYYEEYKCECTGTCGTKIKGYGEECKSREKRYKLFLSELETNKLKKDSIIKLHSVEERKIKELVEKEILIIKANSYGLFDKIRALNSIDKFASIFILLIFIMVETAPLLTKLLSQKGPYDNLVLEYELRFELDYLKQVDNYDNERTKNKMLKEMSTNLEIKSKESEIKSILKNDALERYDKMRNQLDSGKKNLK
jgi:hypothetical protein